MFQFPGFPAYTYGFSICSAILHRGGSPIRKSAGQCSFAAHRSLSQLVTSFVGSRCQGILRMLFFAWTTLNSFAYSGSRLAFAWIAVFILAVSLAKLFLLPFTEKPDFVPRIFILALISCFPYFVCHVCHMHSFEFIWSSLIRFSMNIRPCWALWTLKFSLNARKG